MDKLFHPTLYRAWIYLSMLIWYLGHTSESGSRNNLDRLWYFLRILSFICEFCTSLIQNTFRVLKKWTSNVCSNSGIKESKWRIHSSVAFSCLVSCLGLSKKNSSTKRYSVSMFTSRPPCYKHGLTLIPAWIRNYTLGKVWDEITYPFLNFSGCTVEV